MRHRTKLGMQKNEKFFLGMRQSQQNGDEIAWENDNFD